MVSKRSVKNISVLAILAVAILLFFVAAHGTARTWSITQWQQINGAQGMCYTITDEQGHLIIIDGGFDLNSELILNQIVAHDSHVDAWIITHPHQDHVSVFLNLMEGDFDFDIDTIYAVDFDAEYYESVVAQYDGGYEFFERFNNVTEGLDNLTYVKIGDDFDLCGLDMKVLSAWTDDDPDYLGDPVNQGSMVFKLSGKEKSMLFMADCHSLEYKLKDLWGDELKADYLQVAHHGIGATTSTDFDAFVDPEVAFFDLPEWMNKTEDMNSKEYYDFFVERGVTVYNFGTAPNTVEIQ